MAVLMTMHWPGVTAEQYDEVRERVGWERDAPPGGIHHAAAISDDGLHVSDVWETADEFQRFADERLMPVIHELGIEGEPQVTIYPAHAVYAPGYEGARA